MVSPSAKIYRGRIAPSPTGLLHLGHARTFWTAQQRARASRGTLVLRNDDIDSARFQLEFVVQMIEDLRWFGFDWQEGSDVGGPFAPYNQSERRALYEQALEKLRAAGVIYRCTCSRKDIRNAARAPHMEDEREPVYPGTCRQKGESAPSEFTWRFRVPDGEVVCFNDNNFGPQRFVAGDDFGDFAVWSLRGGNDLPSYQLACVVDDAAMQITEVVRGADLLKSTARQILLYRAMGLQPPEFFHCELVNDENGVRLAKRHDALSLRSFREKGIAPEKLWGQWTSPF